MEEKDIPIIKDRWGFNKEKELSPMFQFSYKYFPFFLFIFKGDVTGWGVENLDDVAYLMTPRMWRVFKRWIPDGFNSVRYFFQKVFRRHHTADYELWGLGGRLAEITLPKLIAFRNQKLHGYPMDFSEWEPEHGEYGGMGLTKAKYDEALEKGEFVGGGFDKWLETIDEMIFAFEYMLYHDDFDSKGNPSRKRRAFYRKHGLKDPYRETEDNLTWHYRYKDKVNGRDMETSELLLDDEKYEVVGKFKVYLDYEASKAHGERAQKGLQLFGKYLWSLWD